jgi:hypothetical protein
VSTCISGCDLNNVAGNVASEVFSHGAFCLVVSSSLIRLSKSGHPWNRWWGSFSGVLRTRCGLETRLQW